MLQNHCKGTDFSPNNQKENTEKITNLLLIFDFGWLCDAEMPKFATTKICQYKQLLVVGLILFQK